MVLWLIVCIRQAFRPLQLQGSAPPWVFICFTVTNGTGWRDQEMTQLINQCSNMLPERHFNATSTQLDFSGVVSRHFNVWLEVCSVCLRASLISMRGRVGWTQSQKQNTKQMGNQTCSAMLISPLILLLVLKEDKMTSKPLVQEYC